MMTSEQIGRDETSGPEDERLAVYEREREELAAAIVKAVQGQYIGKPPPLLTGWQERAVSAVLTAGWLPPAAVQERVDAETAQLRAEVADHARAAGIDEDTKSELAAENIELRAEVARLRDAAANALANQTALKGMTVDEGALVLELGPPRELVIAWVDAARKMLGDAENYSETRIDFPRESISMEVKAAGEFERYVFTVQRAGKITPHEARRASEAEVADMLAHYSRALNEIYRLRQALAYEAGVLAAHLGLKTFPASRRRIAAGQVERMVTAARGYTQDAYSSVNHKFLRSALLAAGAPEGLSRGQWEDGEQDG
jgi:hypothetical protein